MATTYENLAAGVARDGRRKHARWDDTLFAEIACGPGHAVWQTLQDGPLAAPVVSAYLRLVQEALGAGYLRRPVDGASSRWPNFLSFCLVHLIPLALARVPESERLPRLAQIWNLGEGLLREPAWVDRYVTAGTGSLEELSQVEDFLIRALEPALAPAKPARWDGPFALTILDTRPLDDEFLPGEMHLAAPVVVCVHDQRRADVHLLVFLQHDGRSRFLGLSPCLGQYPQAAKLPKVQVTEHQLQVGAHTVGLPFLSGCRQQVLARPGFAVISAVDSQRLWVVESP